MRRRGFHFEDLSSLISVKDKTKKKSKKMMQGMVNLKDAAILKKISKFLLSLSVEDFTHFNNYIKNKAYLKKNSKLAHPNAIKVAKSIEDIIFLSIPENKELAKMFEEFSDNFEVINKYKGLMDKKELSENDLQKCLCLVAAYTDANTELYKKVKEYKETKQE